MYFHNEHLIRHFDHKFGISTTNLLYRKLCKILNVFTFDEHLIWHFDHKPVVQNQLEFVHEMFYITDELQKNRHLFKSYNATRLL